MRLFALLLRIYKNSRKFDNSKRLTCEFVLSGDVACFQRRGVRHNANYVAYAPMRPKNTMVSKPEKGIVSRDTTRIIIKELSLPYLLC